MMSNIGSLPTGQMSTHAPHAVHAHTADSLIAYSSKGGVSPPAAIAAAPSLIAYRLLTSSAAGDSSFPVT